MRNSCVHIFAIEKLLHFSNNVISVQRHFFQYLMACINGRKSSIPLLSFSSTPFRTFTSFQTCRSHIKKNTAKYPTTTKNKSREEKRKKVSLGKERQSRRVFVQFYSLFNSILVHWCFCFLFLFVLFLWFYIIFWLLIIVELYFSSFSRLALIV